MLLSWCVPLNTIFEGGLQNRFKANVLDIKSDNLADCRNLRESYKNERRRFKTKDCST
jgi:hypothetical protein